MLVIDKTHKDSGCEFLVNGEPLSSLPNDLYIPPQALHILLHSFDGPLDLLWYLIKKQNINILDIPMTKIVKQYLEYLALMKALNISLAADYLLMASWLVDIKSRELLPNPNPLEEEQDSRLMLVRQLEHYEYTKKIAASLDEQLRLERDYFNISVDTCDAHDANQSKQVTHIPIELNLLTQAFMQVNKRLEFTKAHLIEPEIEHIRDCKKHILSTLEKSAKKDFYGMVNPEKGVLSVVINFLSVLELACEGLIEIYFESINNRLFIWLKKHGI